MYFFGPPGSSQFSDGLKDRSDVLGELGSRLLVLGFGHDISLSV